MGKEELHLLFTPTNHEPVVGGSGNTQGNYIHIYRINSSETFTIYTLTPPFFGKIICTGNLSAGSRAGILCTMMELRWRAVEVNLRP